LHPGGPFSISSGTYYAYCFDFIGKVKLFWSTTTKISTNC